jgi:hypothetical protein
VERGTPLGEVLRAQAADVREARKRNLLEIGGRKEIAMMIPTNIQWRYRYSLRKVPDVAGSSD